MEDLQLRVVPRAERSAFDRLAYMHSLPLAPAVCAASRPAGDPEPVALGALGAEGWVRRGRLRPHHWCCDYDSIGSMGEAGMQGDGADDQQAQRWLSALRDGTETEKIAARRGLTRVFEQRGMLEEAIELLEQNVRAGVRSGEIFRWLARLSREQGDESRSVEALAEAAKYHPAPFTAAPSASAGLPAGSTPTRTSRDLAPYLLVIIGLGIAVGVAL